MSKRTRCVACGHTPRSPGAIVSSHPEQPCTCAVGCHDQAPIQAGYGPTVPVRPLWPRGALPGKGVTVPLVVRAYPVHPRGLDHVWPSDKGCGNEVRPQWGSPYRTGRAS